MASWPTEQGELPFRKRDGLARQAGILRRRRERLGPALEEPALVAYPEERARGASKLEAIEVAAASSGRAVLIAGSTVMVAMAGMFFAGLSA